MSRAETRAVAAPVSTSTGERPSEELTPERALRQAWLWWFVLLAGPLVMFLVVLWTRTADVAPAARPAVGGGFFLLSLVWLLVMVPGAFLLRSYCFKSYWAGRRVEPHSYVRGMVTIWLATEIGGLLALTGCLLSGMWMPCLLSAALAFILFTPFRPTRRALVDPVKPSE